MSNQHETPCHICGSQAFTWGVVEGRERHKFKADEKSVTDWFMDMRGYAIRARTCTNCGNIQLFVRE